MRKFEKLWILTERYRPLCSTRFKFAKGSQLLALMLCLSVSETYASTEVSRLVNARVNEMQAQISGTISDANGPLPGATIIIKGTSNGTQTDFNGNFSLDATGKSGTLVISYIGFVTQEVAFNGASTINIVLEEDTAQLDEVVVLGYTTRKKGELTGSVSTISSETIEQSSNKDLAKSLAGRASGLIISDRGGAPGARNGNGNDTNDDATTILIRGKATINNNSPLILIDGIQAASFSNLSPQDIASLTVLKDGAAAIYGSRAANGVILITTKRGKSGKPSINFTSSYNLSSFTIQPRLMSSEQFAIYQNEIVERSNSGAPAFTQDQLNDITSGNTPSTDWADLTFADSSPESRNTLSVSGGTDNVKYFVSGDILSQQGLYRSGSLKFDQKQIRSNLDINVTDNITIGTDLLGRFGDRNRPGVNEADIYKAIFTNSPTEVGLYSNGLPGFGGENGNNPLVMSSNQSGFVNRNDVDLRGKFSLNVKLDKLVKGLSWNSFVGIRKMNNDEKSWYTPWTVYTLQDGTGEFIPSTGFSQRGQQRILRESFWKYDETLINSTLRYSTNFGSTDQHALSSFIGLERLDSDTRTFFAERQGFPSDDRPELFAGGSDRNNSGGFRSEFARMDFFGSMSYNYDKKYFIDATLRYDGSSRFGPGNRYGTFPSIAGSWAIDKENFMENVGWINSLRLRGSWATLGNDLIGANQFLTLYDFGADTSNGNSNFNTPRPDFYVFGTEGRLVNGFSASTTPNRDVKWETAIMQNVGLSFNLFDNKLSGDLNYFFQSRKDILAMREAAIADFVGLDLPDENFGEVDNFGYEIELAWNDKIGKVGYNLGFNFTQAQSKVKFLAEGANLQESLKREGLPIDTYIVYPTNGIFRDQAQVDATEAKITGAQEGDINYADINGDGEVNAQDRIRVGTSNVPQIQYGIFGGVNYNNFAVNFLFQGQAKAETLVFFDQSGAKPEFVFNDRWTPNNRNASLPRAFGQGDVINGNRNGNVDVFQGADFYLKDASFVRLKEVELSYTLTKELTKIGDIRIFARGYNLLTFASDIYDLGLDPEATAYNNFRGATYTPLKTYTFGLNLRF